MPLKVHGKQNQGLPWWSSGGDFALRIQEAGVDLWWGNKGPTCLGGQKNREREKKKKQNKTQTSRYGIRGRQGRLWLTLTNLLRGALRSGHWRLHPDIKFKRGEPSLGTADFWDWRVLCGGGCPISWEVFSSWLAPAPLPQLRQSPITTSHSMGRAILAPGNSHSFKVTAALNWISKCKSFQGFFTSRDRNTKV